MILQKSLPYSPWSDSRMSRLPGIQPLDPADWLVMDEAYGPQMAERDRLISEFPHKVHALDGAAIPAARELLDLILSDLAGKDGFNVTPGAVTRPDGATVKVDPENPLMTAGRLVQEDLCLMQRPGGATEHVLTGAILCFPASWTLAEKFMRPLIRIHKPVIPYDDGIAARVQRLFEGLRPGRPLWRANAHFYADPTLFQPRPEAAPRSKVVGPAPFLRSERQCLLRLPETGAVVFSIHTYMIRREDLTDEQKRSLEEHPIEYSDVAR